MKIIKSLSQIPSFFSPVVLTIGMFDGIHLGHQSLIKELHFLTRKRGTRALLTFENHPTHVFCPNSPTPLVMSLEQRLFLLEKYGLDLVIVLPFTKDFATRSYDDFLKELHQNLPFSHLVLGEGASMGKNREGNPQKLQAFASSIGFNIEFLKKERHHRETISSENIRQMIREGKLKKLKKCLGRPYSLWQPANRIPFAKENEDLYTGSWNETGLVPLPCGVYGVDLEWDNQKTQTAIAFIRHHRTLSESDLSITLYLEKPPEEEVALSISFVEYMHEELDPALLELIPNHSLKDFSTQPSLS